MPTPESGSLPVVDDARFLVIQSETDVEIAREMVEKFRNEFADLSEEDQAQIRRNYREQRGSLIDRFSRMIHDASMRQVLIRGSLTSNFGDTAEAVADILIDLVDPQGE